MKKLLRLSFIALMAMVANVAMAQNVLWEEDFGSYVAGDVPAGGAYSYKCTDGKSATKIYEEAIAQGTSPELLIGKKDASTNGGTFKATIDITNVNEEMTLTFKANKNLSVSVEGGTLGEKTNNGNDYSYPITKTADALTITFENTLTQNARFDNVKLFTGQGKKAPGLSWGTSARTVTIDADDNNFPTLTNPFELPITYTSSEESVATIAADGTITLVADGQTIIKAEFAGNDEYEAGAAQYTLTVKPAPTPAIDVTVAEALAIIDGLEDKAQTEQTYNVTCTANIVDFQRNNQGELYGNVNIETGDEQGHPLYIYRCKNIGNVNFTEETISDLKEGDVVIVCGQLKKYIDNDNMVEPRVINCYLVAINPESGISAVTVNANYNAPMYNLAGQKVNANYKGVVIQNGKKFIVK